MIQRDAPVWVQQRTGNCSPRLNPVDSKLVPAFRSFVSDLVAAYGIGMTSDLFVSVNDGL
jgi:hypothetical protein